MITIVIADDEKLIRTGLKIILQENLDIPLEILEAKNGKEALDLCNEKKPDLLITDIRMPYKIEGLPCENDKPCLDVVITQCGEL